MQIYNLKTDAEKLQKTTQSTKTAIALGQFDAMHIGHSAIIKSVVRHARENGLFSLVHIFDNNPIEAIRGEKIPSINTLEKRLEILRSIGVDIVCIAHFDAEYMNIKYKDFVSLYLHKIFGASLVSVGYNYRFGKGGVGDAQALKNECKKHAIDVTVMPQIELSGEVVSSTLIREKLTQGDVEDVAKMLGRYFSIRGEVVYGNQIGGERLGFPTANIEIPDEVILPKPGVYITRTRVGDKMYRSITNLGLKPTVEKDIKCIETHIDGVFGSLYGEVIEVEFCAFLRDTKKFDSLDALSEQLKKDKKMMQSIVYQGFNEV